jgi:hypothetical protein
LYTTPDIRWQGPFSTNSGLERFRLGLTTTAGVSWIDILYALAISLPGLLE